MWRRDFNTPDAHPPFAAYTHAIEVSRATRTLYISGQVGQRMDVTIPDDIVEQSRLAWQNLEAQLKAAGMTLDNLVKITTILPNHGDLAAAREGRSKVPKRSQVREHSDHRRPRQTRKGETSKLDEPLTPKPSSSRVSSQWKPWVKSRRKSTACCRE
jgi:2-iminobutanoate/2-iminopropanoate deaminase